MMAEGRTGMLGRLSKVASHLAAGADLVRVQLPDGDAAVPELFGPQRGGRSVDKNHGNLHEDFPAPGRPPPAEPVPGYLAHTVPSAEQLHSWVEKFHTDGFLYLPKVLPPALCAKLREDLDWVLENAPAGEGRSKGRASHDDAVISRISFLPRVDHAVHSTWGVSDRKCCARSLE